MANKKLILLSILVALSGVLGCSSAPQANPDGLFAKDCKHLNIPGVEAIKQHGMTRRYPYVTFEEVWDSAIITLIQQGIIVHLSRNSGIIVTAMSLPIVTLVEPDRDAVVVYLCRLENFFTCVGQSKKFVISDFKYEAEILFDKLSTQVYAGMKWEYLYRR